RQRFSRGAIGRVARDPPALLPREPGEVRPRRPEAELVVKPDRAGRERLVVAEAELVGREVEGADAEPLTDECEQPVEDPRRFAPAEGLEDVVRDLAPVEEERGVSVADGDTVLQKQITIVGAEREAVRREEPEPGDLDSAPGLRDDDVVRVGEVEAVDLAVPNDDRGAGRVEEIRS